MENKTTIELLELLWKLDKQSEKKEGEIDWDKWEEALAELRKREPFSGIFGESEDSNDPTLEERIEVLEEIVKSLKRHKHDEKSGDVMIRI